MNRIINVLTVPALLCTVLCLQLQGQQTSVYSEQDRPFKYGLELYDQGIYGGAEQSFREIIHSPRPLHERTTKQSKHKAELLAAQAAVARGSIDGEQDIQRFIHRYRPDPLVTEAILEMGDYYYSEKKYKEAIRYYEMLESAELTEVEQSEASFKQGYCHFVQKEFKIASDLLTQTKDIKNKYFYPSNYYYGMSQYFLEKYEEAINALRIAGHSRDYESYIPYYLTAIYFSKEDYEKVISYASPLLKKGTVRNEEDIYLILAQAHFEQEQFEQALPHFKTYEQRTASMRTEDFYMMGYSAYRTSQFEEAIESFKTVSGQDNALTQLANFHLGDCYLKLSEKQSARTAFANAARIESHPDLRADARFQYAKLSAELGYDREAVRVLQQIKPDSEYYLPSQQVLKDIFLNTRDYARAIDIIEQMPQKTPDIKEAYQKVSYYRAMQYLSDDNYREAMVHLDQSLDNPIDQKIRSMALYWKADIQHRQEEYRNSIGSLNKYFTLAKREVELPAETSIHVANYLQGYNHLKQQEYTLGLGYFRDAAEGIQLDDVNLEDAFIEENILSDALVRTADCYFKRNQYESALKYYNQAIEMEQVGYVYALYQKAIIQGLQGKNYKKILSLEDLVQNYPQSNYADDALLEMGDTYMGLNQFDEASKPLQKLVSNYSMSSPLLTQALLKLGLISYNQGDARSAIRFYKQVFDYNPTAEEVRGAMQAIEEIYVNDLGKPEEYVQFVEEHTGMNIDALKRDSLTYRSAYIQYENGNDIKAIEGFDKYLDQFPNGVRTIAAHFYRGESHLTKQQYSRALNDFDQVVEQGPGAYYANALRKAAIISYNHEQSFDQALRYYSELYDAANTDEVKHEAAMGAIRSAQRTDQWSAVKKWANIILKSEQSGKEEKNRAHFYLGKFAFQEDRTDDALKHLNQVTRMSNNELTAEARYLIAKMYFDQGEIETAEKLCKEAVKESSSYPVWVAKTLLLLSDVQIAQEDLFNAKAAVDAIIENFTSDENMLERAKDQRKRIEQLEAEDSKIREERGDSLLDMRENQNE